MADRDIPEEMVEKAALEMHDQSCTCDGSERCRQSALYPPGVTMQTARAILSAALAGRQVVDLPQRSVIDKDDVTFPGCTTNNPDLCACGSWEPLTCDACGEEFKAGDEIHLHTTKGVPFLPDAHSDQEWTHWTWHVTCDERAAGSGSGEQP